MSLSRRKFLGLAAGAGALGAAGLAACSSDRKGGASSTSTPDDVGAIDDTSTSSASDAPSTSTIAPTTTAKPSPSNDHVLVVVQLGGGNDGLNTLVPLDGRYHDARPTIGLADDALVKFPGSEGYGLHGALAPLSGLLAAGQIAALEAIGYPKPNRSHFAALDDWWSGTPGQASTTGWLGRWLDITATDDDDPLRAVALGAGVPALAAAKGRAAVVLSPKAYVLKPPKGSSASLVSSLSSGAGDRRAGSGRTPTDLADEYRAAVADAAKSVATFDALKAQKLEADGASDSPAGGELTQSLALAAQLIAEHRTTRVVHVTLGGFDTHANQLTTQEKLLGDVGAGIARLFTDLARTGDDKRVLLMTVSEFGRRVKENGSGGTDHGKASVQFVAGPAVVPGVYGQADLVALNDGDLAPQLDVRSMYTLALDWLGTPADDVLDKRYDTVGILRKS
jgi:uncharacterized protein (DUF1501 family)